MGAVSSEPVSHVDKRTTDEYENPGSIPEYPASESSTDSASSSRRLENAIEKDSIDQTSCTDPRTSLTPRESASHLSRVSRLSIDRSGGRSATVASRNIPQCPTVSRVKFFGRVHFDGESGGQRVPIRVPRIRHVAGSEMPRRSYEALHGDRAVDDRLLKRVLSGISCRNYEAAAEAIPGAIGLSGSTVSRGFIQASAAKLRELQERDLSGEDVVAVVLDGKTFAEATMVIALGITIAGGKRFLGFVETDTETERVLTPFLRSLVERGLDISQGVLVILDGSKGLRAAVRKAFRQRALVHRCQWHKRENVVSYLAKREQASWRPRLQRAYNRPAYDEARAALETLHRELEDRNQSAAGSLKEGLDETLTLHRRVYQCAGRGTLCQG